MAEWPSDLPDRWLRSGLSESLADNTIRSQVDRGPAKVRRRTIAGVRTVSGSMHMTHAQWDTLVNFYNDTVKGTIEFAMPDPFDEEDTVQVRFTAAPRKSYFSPGAVRVDLAIEIMTP